MTLTTVLLSDKYVISIVYFANYQMYDKKNHDFLVYLHFDIIFNI